MRLCRISALQNYRMTKFCPVLATAFVVIYYTSNTHVLCLHDKLSTVRTHETWQIRARTITEITESNTLIVEREICF